MNKPNLKYPHITDEASVGDVIYFDAPTRANSRTLKIGEYMVTRVACDGGGRSNMDFYPDGHHVWVRKLEAGKYNDKAPELDFYQSGCFSEMLERVTVIRKMTQTFI